MLAQVVHLQRVSQRIAMPLEVLPFLREDQAMVVIVRSVGQLQLGLMRFMLTEEVSRL